MPDNKIKTIAIITARGGSKGLVRKNICNLAGKPLVAYSIEAAKNCDLIDTVVVTTDDDEIAEISRKFGAEILKRPAELATDTASSYDTVKHVLESGANSQYDFFVLLQPTSPLRNATHITEALEQFQKTDCKSAISVCIAEHHPYKDFIAKEGRLVPLFDAKYLGTPRQELVEIYRQNGAIYIMRCHDFLYNTDDFYLPPVMPYVMSAEDSIDIDTALDLRVAEQHITN
jgi:CMP-N-acetylneuraminic acid synthetase